MSEWMMLTLVGEDRPGIVAAVTAALHEGGCYLGETSMIRLGGNFTIMMMVRCADVACNPQMLLEPVVRSMGLRVHKDVIDGHLHSHIEPNVRISVYGADRAGIVADVTRVLAQLGLNILGLESDVGGSDEKPIYILHIEGVVEQQVGVVESALRDALGESIDVTVMPIDTCVG